MRHLSPDERLALIEALEEPRHPHLETCDACRHDVAAARLALDEARAVEVPEPSPLFWNHLSARISAALDEGATVRAGPRRIAWPILVPLAVGLLAIVLVVRVEQRRPVAAPAQSPAAAGAVRTAADEEPLVEDEGWDVLGRLADDFDVETLSDALGHSMTAGAGAGIAVWQLNDDERAELARLLRAETQPGRSGR